MALSVTSSRSSATCGCLDAISVNAANAGSVPTWREVAMTFQPLAAYWRASSSPMPRFAPVISTVGASFLKAASAVNDTIARTAVSRIDLNMVAWAPALEDLEGVNLTAATRAALKRMAVGLGSFSVRIRGGGGPC